MTSSWIKDHPLTEGWNCRDMNRGVHSLNFTRIHDKDKLYKDYTLAVHMMTSSMETFSALLALCGSPVNSPHKGQWRGALMFSLIYAWTSGWENHWDAVDLRCYRAHYDAIVMRCDTDSITVKSMISWHGMFSASLDLWRGSPPVADGFPSQRASNTLNWKAGYQGLNSPWNGWLVVT